MAFNVAPNIFDRFEAMERHLARISAATARVAEALPTLAAHLDAPVRLSMLQTEERVMTDTTEYPVNNWQEVVAIAVMVQGAPLTTPLSLIFDDGSSSPQFTRYLAGPSGQVQRVKLSAVPSSPVTVSFLTSWVGGWVTDGAQLAAGGLVDISDRATRQAGVVRVQDSFGDNIQSTGPLVDGQSNTSAYLLVEATQAAFNGVSHDRVRLATTFKNIVAQAVVAGTPVSIWTPATGNKFRIQGWALSLSVAGAVLLRDGTTGAGSTERIRTPSMAAGQGLIAPEMDNGILSNAANNQLWIDVTASGAVSGYVFGNEE